MRLPERVKCLALDIDGTLTLGRSVYSLDLELASLLRGLAQRGVYVVLVTGNALPVVGGLARYLSLDAPHSGENGCLILDGNSVVKLCSRSTTHLAELVESRLSSILVPSWQNMFRLYDLAYRARGVDPAEASRRLQELLAREGHGWVRVGYSGYAIHLRPPEASKGRALRYILEKLGVAPEETIAVGDSVIDTEFLEATPYLVAVANADAELREKASLVLPAPSSQGVRMLVEKLLRRL